MRRVIKTASAAVPRGTYAQGWRAGDFIFVSGQVPRDPSSGEVLQTHFHDQVIRTLLNVEAVLKAEGASLQEVIKFTVILEDLANVDVMNEAFRELLSAPLPARTTFQGGLMGVPIEIDAIAFHPPSID